MNNNKNYLKEQKELMNKLYMGEYAEKIFVLMICVNIFALTCVIIAFIGVIRLNKRIDNLYNKNVTPVEDYWY